MNNITEPQVLTTENGELDAIYYCARVKEYVTLSECERLCPRYSSCDNVAIMNDEIKDM